MFRPSPALAITHENITRLLLERDADVNAQNHRGHTPLCWAARDGPVTVAKHLLEFTANINTTDSFGCTAILRDHEEMLQVLLDHGANPESEDKNGWTALHLTALRQNDRLIQMLSKNVVNPDAILDWVASQQQDPKRMGLFQKIAADKAEGSTVMSGLR